MSVQVGDDVVVLFDDNHPNPSGTVEWVSSKDATIGVKITRCGRGYSPGDIIVTQTYSVRPYTWARSLPTE